MYILFFFVLPFFFFFICKTMIRAIVLCCVRKKGTNDKHEKKGRTSEEQKGSERKLELVGAITDLLNIRKAPAPDDYWSCHLCTYNNTLTATSCDVCGTARLTPATKNENSSTQNGGSAADVDTSSSRDLTKDTGTDDGADPEDEGDGSGLLAKARSVTHLAHFRASDSDINRPNVRYLFVCLFICFFFPNNPSKTQANSWICETCSYGENSLNTPVCQVCGAVPPERPPAPQTSVDSKTNTNDINSNSNSNSNININNINSNRNSSNDNSNDAKKKNEKNASEHKKHEDGYGKFHFEFGGHQSVAVSPCFLLFIIYYVLFVQQQQQHRQQYTPKKKIDRSKASSSSSSSNGRSSDKVQTNNVASNHSERQHDAYTILDGVHELNKFYSAKEEHPNTTENANKAGQWKLGDLFQRIVGGVPQPELPFPFPNSATNRSNNGADKSLDDENNAREPLFFKTDSMSDIDWSTKFSIAQLPLKDAEKISQKLMKLELSE
ncbi:hypothetical protein RFI_09090 [Reticulomyxa filosa]|uniref:RanBP2-type domain-containing protein n=1 Tax=Reticulomyxa filosa TaxID=46433 RepID=X6NRS5_RETFI|nr:hypothetical protein RFI_09090 [Reticulomyxa filosa]|eukprot:ETO28042.1 hypothetical protein RFI_09090 [Reticulomyxa filosa]